ncbi:UNVERIFIED_CONTAM: hypothetical protein FKN15_073978 [Acipenser sinensis]
MYLGRTRVNPGPSDPPQNVGRHALTRVERDKMLDGRLSALLYQKQCEIAYPTRMTRDPDPGRGQQPINIRLSVMAVTRRASLSQSYSGQELPDIHSGVPGSIETTGLVAGSGEAQ